MSACGVLRGLQIFKEGRVRFRKRTSKRAWRRSRRRRRRRRDLSRIKWSVSRCRDVVNWCVSAYHRIHMSKFSVDESKSGTLLERALNHATRERVFVAPRVVQSGHSRCGGSTKGLREISSDYSVYKRVRVSERTSRLNSNSKSLETVRNNVIEHVRV